MDSDASIEMVNIIAKWKSTITWKKSQKSKTMKLMAFLILQDMIIITGNYIMLTLAQIKNQSHQLSKPQKPNINQIIKSEKKKNWLYNFKLKAEPFSSSST